jgi:tetratricopeptide (TPR) repeat protein/S1-C subfamily serine protease
LLDKKLQGGYQIGYTNEVEKGMSGGPVLNIQGQLVGINGIHAQPLWENPYVYEDGTQPNDTLKQRMKSSSWAVPIQLLAKLAPQFVPAEIAQSANEVKTATAPLPQLTNRVDSIAKEITVLITDPTGNGSGVIVAHEGDTYYVLTAKHVVIDDYQQIRQIKVFTPKDDQEHPVDISKTKIWDGIDLALVQFTSNQKYDVAELANYSLDIEDQVIFVSGFPGAKQVNVKSGRQFNAGFLLNWSSSPNSAIDDHSFSFGAELVYSNITAEGMSGGPLLDIEGRLIGIHRAAEATDGEKPSPIPEEEPGNPKVELGYSLGIPVRTLLAKLKEDNIKLNFKLTDSPPKQQLTVAEQDEIVSAYLNLKQPEKSANEVKWLNYGNKLWRLRRYEQAEQAFDKAIKLKPDFYDAWYSHGMALVRLEKYKQAIKSFETAVKYSSQKPGEQASQAWRQLGDAYWYSGEYEQAVKAFDKAIELKPNDFILYNWKADALSSLGRYPEALEAGTTSIKKYDKHSESYLRRAITRGIHLQDYSGAIEDVDKALALQPDLAYGYQYRGIFRSFQKDYTGAIDDLTQAINLKSKFAGAYACSTKLG